MGSIYLLPFLCVTLIISEQGFMQNEQILMKFVQSWTHLKVVSKGSGSVLSEQQE